MFLEREDDAVGNDGEEDGVFEGRPLDQELGRPTDEVLLGQDEQGAGARPAVGVVGPAHPAAGTAAAATPLSAHDEERAAAGDEARLGGLLLFCGRAGLLTGTAGLLGGS